MLEKLHHLLRLPILHIFCKLLIPCKKCSIALCLVPLQPPLVSPMAGFISSCIYFNYHLQHNSTIPPLVQRMWFCQSLDNGRIATERKREQQDWHQQQDLQLQLTCKHWQDDLTFLIYYPTIVKDPKRTPATVSLYLTTTRNCRENSSYQRV